MTRTDASCVFDPDVPIQKGLRVYPHCQAGTWRRTAI